MSANKATGLDDVSPRFVKDGARVIAPMITHIVNMSIRQGIIPDDLIPEQAGFRPGKSCTSHLLNLTEHIEDGYEKRLITGAVFVDLSAACDTVNHRRLLSKVLEMTGDVQLTDLIRTTLENRRFFVVPNGKKSRWRRQRNGLVYHREVYWHRCCSTSTPTTSPYTPTLAASSTQTTCASRRKETTSTTSKCHSRLP